jgi:hypothetical protein
MLTWEDTAFDHDDPLTSRTVAVEFAENWFDAGPPGSMADADAYEDPAGYAEDTQEPALPMEPEAGLERFLDSFVQTQLALYRQGGKVPIEPSVFLG